MMKSVKPNHEVTHKNFKTGEQCGDFVSIEGPFLKWIFENTPANQCNNTF